MSSNRLSKVLKELNIGLDTAVDFLADKGHEVERNRNAKIDDGQYDLLLQQFQQDKSRKEKSERVIEQKKEEKELLRAEREAEEVAPAPVIKARAEGVSGPKLVGKIDLNAKKEAPKPEPTPAPEPEKPKAEPKPEPVKVEKAPEVEKPKAEEPKPTPAPAPEPPKKEEKMEEPKPAPVAEEKKEEPAPPKEEKSAPAPAAEVPAPAAEAPAPAPETPAPTSPAAAPEAKEGTATDPDHHKTQYTKLEGPRLTGQTIDLSKFERPKKKKVASSAEGSTDAKRKRKRINKTGPGGTPAPGGQPGQGGGNRPQRANDNRQRGKAQAPAAKAELTDEDIQRQIKETLEKLTGNKKSKGAKLRRSKRDERREMEAMAEIEREEQSKILKVTEFVTVTELATMMSVPTTQVISACMSLGIMVTMNQRLDAETLTIVAEEFGYGVEFVDTDLTEAFTEEADLDEDLQSRAPIVTVMGHVDHGKTSLLDYVRKTNVIAGESGGITQHIGAYNVELSTGQHITFLDTPGHEAFTAMRARGAQVTDVVIIVVAADDAVMPQTKEAISHAQAAGVPFVVAINKVDKANANSDKIREQLAGMNILVEDWGGKVQCQEISAKSGQGVKELLDKVLLEAEILDLKANPDRMASGTVIEASLDKGRGYLSTILVQNGSLRVGDYLLAGPYSGKVRAMLDERGHRINVVGPSGPVSVLGLDGAPQAGDKFTVMEDEREAKQIATRRQQLMREQSVRTTKNITLEEIGRRLALGDFKELNIILKGDVDGSIEALTDSLQKLSTEQIQVRIIHRAVGQISESDILLAAASNAIIVGFQVRPSANARKLAEKEEVDIRLYSIIYDAINEVKAAMEGMLSPDVKEEIVCNLEIRETFKITKVGTVAGCMVTDGTITRNTRVRIIRDGVVIYTGELGSLKRFKDDVKEVNKGYECGLNIHNFNDIKVGDVIEGFKEVEVKKTL